MPRDIDDLIRGYKVFRQKYFTGRSQLFDQLTKNGQNPKILIISCSDSRVDPSLILNCKPGDLFVVRNVSNLIPPCDEDKSSYHGTSAAIEFAICKLGIRHIIILGHSQCGGITSLLNQAFDKEEKSFISKWMEIAENARKKTIESCEDLSLEQQIDICAKHSIVNSIDNLLTFPWIEERVNKHQLFIHGWYFDIETGTIKEYLSENKSFEELGNNIFFNLKIASN
jgi:carbonic anhydrase